jgi:hypothetical protein
MMGFSLPSPLPLRAKPKMMKKATDLAKQATKFATGVAVEAAKEGVTKTLRKTATQLAVDAATRAATQMVGKQVGQLARKIDPTRLAEQQGAPKIEVRKVQLTVEEIWHDNGPRAKKPHLRGAVAMVIKNPYAGRYVEDITPMMDALKPLGYDMAERLIKALGGAKKIEAYGKGAIIGVDGELEHGALWHAPGGYGMRELMEKSFAIVPSAKKVGAAGTAIDIPVHHRQASYVRSHFDAFEVRVPDAPRPGEIVYILAMTTGPRVHARVGGLKASEISKNDGQR